MSTRSPMLIAGSANQALAEAVAREAGSSLTAATIERFPDMEVHVELHEDPRGRQVFILQSTSPPPDEHIFELLALADACRRADAARITAIVPYFGYARQDRRTRNFEAVGARLVADLMLTAGIQRVVTLDLHTDAIEGFFTQPVVRLTAVPILADALRAIRTDDSVIVSPDLGAAKLAESYSNLLDLPVAIVHKTRLGPERVTATRITGDVKGRKPIIIDDMISTGATIEAAVWAVVTAGAQREGIVVAATHGLFAGDCVNRFRSLEVARFLITDSVSQRPTPGLSVETASVAVLIARTIRGLAKEP